MKIVIGVPTYKRPEMLLGTLTGISKQSISELLSFIKIEVLVVDNDELKSSKTVVDSLKNFPFTVHYAVQPERGLPFVRNKVLEEAANLQADALIFIDDDEVPRLDWLYSMVSYYLKNKDKVQAVRSPVYPVFEVDPPDWLPQEMYSKPLKLATGKRLKVASTNNVLVDMNFVKQHNLKFNEKLAFCSGEDTDFFRRLTGKGGVIHWLSSAKVDEFIPKTRMTFKWFCQRAFRYGSSGFYTMKLYKGYWYALWYFFPRTGWWVLKGLANIRFSKKSFARASRYILLASGIFYGALGFKWNEYEKTHGK